MYPLTLNVKPKYNPHVLVLKTILSFYYAITKKYTEGTDKIATIKVITYDCNEVIAAR